MSAEFTQDIKGLWQVVIAVPLDSRCYAFSTSHAPPCTTGAGDQWDERMQASRQTLRWMLAQACGSYSAASVLRAGNAAKKAQGLDVPHSQAWLLV